MARSRSEIFLSIADWRAAQKRRQLVGGRFVLLFVFSGAVGVCGQASFESGVITLRNYLRRFFWIGCLRDLRPDQPSGPQRLAIIGNGGGYCLGDVCGSAGVSSQLSHSSTNLNRF